MTIEIDDSTQHAPPPDGYDQLPYQGFWNDTEGEADTGTVASSTATNSVVTADTTYLDSRTESSVALSAPLGSSSNASVHVVGGEFLAAVENNLKKARIRRFF